MSIPAVETPTEVDSFRIETIESSHNRHNVRSNSSILNLFETEAAISTETDSDESESQDKEDQVENSSACCWCWKQAFWPGLGLFGESYLLFSIGTMQPIWEILFEECFNEDCSPSLLAALHYSVVLGVIAGMLAIGYASKYTGRRTGSIVTAFLMASGAAGLTMTSLFLTEIQETLIRSMVFFWFIFGFGVGGEYPMAASQASENAASKKHPTDQQQHRHHQQQQSDTDSSGQKSQDGLIRPSDGEEGGPLTSSFSATTIQSTRGRQVQLVFSMQGLGILLNSVTITALLLITMNYMQRLEEENTNMVNQNQGAKYQLHDISTETANALLAIWRLTYGFGMLVLVYVWLSRYMYLKESKIWLQLQREEQLEPPPDSMTAEMPQPSEIVCKTTTALPFTKENERSSSNLHGVALEEQQEHNEWESSALDRPSTLLDSQYQDIPQSGFKPVVSTTGTLGDDHPRITPHPGNSPATADAVLTYGPQASPLQRTTTNTSQRLSSLSLKPTLSAVSSISSLSAPSLLAEFVGSQDENSYYHFMHDGGEAACGPVVAKWNLLYQLYGARLFGVSACWLLWDIAFYGNKLFQSSFLLAMIGRGSSSNDGNNNNQSGNDQYSLQYMLDFSVCATLNATVAFAGYMVAALLVDIPAIGRRRLQLWGFIATGVLFVACGFLLDRMSPSSSRLLLLLYFGTSFFGQVGPNCTTFLIPAEIFPTEIRTLCHGIAAASGKMGALFAAVIFNYTQSDLDMFLLSGYASLVAGFVTFWTIPESFGLPLEELDQKWKSMINKKPYHGPANYAKYLSLYERSRLCQLSQTGDPVNAFTNHPTMDYRPEVEVY